MRIICIDDEPLILEMTADLCRELPMKPEVIGFSNAADTLSFLENQEADIALIDINMPDMNGLKLAEKIHARVPDLALIFLTGYSEYAVDAFRIHAAGYLLKPISRKRLTEEINHAVLLLKLNGRLKDETPKIQVRTFGGFDLFVDGNAVAFARSKSKELLAILVDRQGSTVSRAVAFSILWENVIYDRPMQKQMDVVIRALRATLQRIGAEGMVEMQQGTMRVVPEKIDCDLYRFLEGDPKAVQSFRGEYMSDYSWASQTEAYLSQMRLW